MTESFDRVRVWESAERLRAERIDLRNTRDPRTSAGNGLPGGWAPVHESMASIVATQPTDIAGVLSRQIAIQRLLDQLPPNPALHRVGAFNSLYYTITDRVAQSLRGPRVTDPVFLEMLDVEFAKRYFRAIQLWGEDEDSAPDAWEVLFRRGADKRVSRLAAAMLGVNAHINFDLAMALIATWEQLGPPAEDDPHPDYVLINTIFYEEIPALRRRYSSPWQMNIDVLCGNLDDWSQRLLVLSTRALAWDQAMRIWPLRANKADFEHAQLVMDRATAYLGETLVIGDGLVNWVGAMLTGAWHMGKGLAGGFRGRKRRKIQAM